MSRKNTLVAVVVVLAMPAAFALIEAVTFHVHNRNSGSMISSGETREYLLHLPRNYDRTRAAPLVISLHGAGGWPAQQMDTSGWNRLADREQFIVVYPSGADSGGPRIWRVDRRPELRNDVRFISELIDRLESDYSIDRSRIYVDGLSNGGGMAFVLSCTLSDRIAAVGMVAAAQTLPWKWCTDDRPVPMIAFHGTADPVVPYRGGPSWLSAALFPDVRTWVARWARRNGCGSRPVDTAVAADVVRREYANCADGADVVLYSVVGGGHSWPGGGPLPEWLVGRETHSIDATARMWAFFREHRLPQKPPAHTP